MIPDSVPVSLFFSEPIGIVYFERGQKNRVRTFFYWEGIEAGATDVTMFVELPEDAQRLPTLDERYGEEDVENWLDNLLHLSKSFIDLSHLNHRPAGKHGFAKPVGGGFEFEDGTPVRFWGANIQAYSIFIDDKAAMEAHAKRIAALGFNLVRLHHHDSQHWVRDCLIRMGPTSQEINPDALDSYFYWIKCLRENGVYVWLDLHVGRTFRPGDDIPGFEEARANEKRVSEAGIEMKGYSHVNDRVTELMQQFNEQLLTRENPYTGLALKDDPAIMGLLLSNENDLTHHFGNKMNANRNVPYHYGLMQERVSAFSQKHGFDPGHVSMCWDPGVSKIFLNDTEAEWFDRMIGHLREIGVRQPICAGHIWGGMTMTGLPSLTKGGIIDTHSYEPGEFLSNNPRYKPNFATSIIRSHVIGYPLSITEYNSSDHHETRDPFVLPPYIAALSAFQRIDAPMLFAYSQDTLEDMYVRGHRAYGNNGYKYPGIIGLYPAAALIYRRDIAPARETWVAKMTRESLFMQDTGNTKAFRTLQLQHGVRVAIPEIEELPWLNPSEIPAEAKTFADPHRDFLPEGQTYVESDTGELKRDWEKGLFTINAAGSQGAAGWLGKAGRIALDDVAIQCNTRKATILLSSLDDKPLNHSESILISTAARCIIIKARGGRNRRHLGHGALKLLSALASGATFQIVFRHEGRDLLRQSKRRQVVDRRMLSLGEVANGVVQ